MEGSCSFCGRRAVYERRYAGVRLCDRHFIRSVEHRFRRLVREQRLIEKKDRILLALSGGKDSITLLHLLAERRDEWGFDMVAVTIDEGIRGFREHCIEYAKRAADRLGVEWKLFTFEREYGHTLDEILLVAEREGLPEGPCTYCGVLRRSLLNKVAKNLGATKVATAHNLDDEAEAIMLDYIRGDLNRLSRLGPKYEAREGFVPRIKPLRDVMEEEIHLYARLKGLDFYEKRCPYRRGLHAELGEFLDQLERKHPNSKYMIVRFFDRIKPALDSLLPENFQLRSCQVCGEPSVGELCKACQLLKRLGMLKTP